MTARNSGIVRRIGFNFSKALFSANSWLLLSKMNDKVIRRLHSQGLHSFCTPRAGFYNFFLIVLIRWICLLCGADGVSPHSVAYKQAEGHSLDDLKDYQTMYRYSLTASDAFWDKAARDVVCVHVLVFFAFFWFDL